MLDTTALSQAIETLATETEANAISPAYLAAVLRKMADLISTAYTAAVAVGDAAQTTADDAREDARNVAKDITAEAKKRAAADAQLQEQDTTNKNYLINFVRGRSDDNNGYYEPFIYGGSYNDEDAWETMLEAISTHPMQEENNYTKYTGHVRYDIQGVIFDVQNYPIHYATGQWLQVISGGVMLNTDGTISRKNSQYGTFYRMSDNSTWGKWQDIQALDPKAVHHVTFSYDASTRILYGFQYDANGNRLANYTDASNNTYHVELLLATTSRPGLMSMSDKLKLDAYPDYSTLLNTIKSMVNA